MLIWEDFTLNIRLSYTIVGNCKVKINIWAKQTDQFLMKKLFIKTDIEVFLRSEVIVLLYPIFLPDDRDFLFYLIAQANLTLFDHIIKHKTIEVFVRNNSDRPLYISIGRG